MIKQPCLAGAKGKEIVGGKDEEVLIDRDQLIEDHKCQADELLGFNLFFEGLLNIFMQ